MDARELIGKRVLLSQPKSYYGTSVEECKILEVSPSGVWVKVMNIHGNKYWKETAKVSVVEVLQAKPEYPQSKKDGE